MHAGYARAWMSPQAQHQNLIYVSNANNNTVSVYGLSSHKLLGMLTDISAPYGVCTDNTGHVWVVANNKVVEYAHAGTTPIRTLSAPNTDLYDCAVDPATGNLAVTNWGVNNWYQGNVLVYAPGATKPAVYTAQGVWFYFGAAYDNKGNLFVDAWDAYLNGYVTLGELKKGSKTLKQVPLVPSFQPPFLGGMRWDGKYLAILDWNSLALYSVSGGYGHLKGFSPLTNHWPIGEFWILNYGSGKQQLLAPDTAGHPFAVQFWNYPRCGAPIGTLSSDKLDGPWGATVSLAQSR